MRRSIAWIAILILMAATSRSAAQDPLSGLVGVALMQFGGSKISDIIKQFQNTGEALIREGGNTGNSLLVTAGSELQAFLANASFILRDSQDRLYKEVGFNQQAVLAVVLLMSDEIEQSRQFARDFRDSTILDLNALVDRIPFVRNQFFVQSLRGMVQVQKRDGEYRFRLFGTRLQPYFANRAVDFELRACNTENQCTTPIPMRFVLGSPIPNSVDLFVQAASLEQYFSADKMTVLNASLAVKFSTFRRGRVVGTEEHAVPLHFSLFPELAGSGEAQGAIEEFAWRPVNNLEVPRIYANPNPLITPNYDCHTRPGSDCEHPDHFRQDLTLPRLPGIESQIRGRPAVGSQRYADVRITCDPPTRTETRRVWVERPGPPRRDRVGGAADGWRYVTVQVLSPCIWSNNNWHYVDNERTQAIANIDTYSHPAIITFSAIVEEYKKINERAWTSGEIQFYYGRTLEVIVPADTVSMPHFVGKSLQGRTFDFVLGQPGAAGLFTLLGPPERRPDGAYVVRYEIRRPDWETLPSEE